MPRARRYLNAIRRMIFRWHGQEDIQMMRIEVDFFMPQEEKYDRIRMIWLDLMKTTKL